VAVSETLTPGTAGDVLPSLTDGEGTFSGGMLDGWILFDPDGDVTAINDGVQNSGEFTITWDPITSSYRWLTSNRQTVSHAPFLAYPELMTGDFEIEVCVTAPADAAVAGRVANGNFDFMVGALQRPAYAEGMTHYIGCLCGRYWSTAGQVRAGAYAGNGSYAYQVGAGTFDFADENWLKIKREGAVVTAQYKLEGGAYQSVNAALPPDEWDWSGAAVYVGIGMATDVETNYISVLNVNVTGTEVA